MLHRDVSIALPSADRTRIDSDGASRCTDSTKSCDDHGGGRLCSVGFHAATVAESFMQCKPESTAQKKFAEGLALSDAFRYVSDMATHRIWMKASADDARQTTGR